MPHPFVRAKIFNGSFDIGELETDDPFGQAALCMALGRESFSFRNEIREPSSVLAQIGRGWVLLNNVFVLRIPEKSDRLKPSNHVLHQAVPPSEMIFGIEIDHQPDRLPARRVCRLIHGFATMPSRSSACQLGAFGCGLPAGWLGLSHDCDNQPYARPPG